MRRKHKITRNTIIALAAWILGAQCMAAAAPARPAIYITGIPSVCLPGAQFRGKIVIDGAGVVSAVKFTLYFDKDVLEITDGDSTREGKNLAANAPFLNPRKNQVTETEEDNMGGIKYAWRAEGTPPTLSGPAILAEFTVNVAGDLNRAGGFFFLESSYEELENYVTLREDGVGTAVEPVFANAMVYTAPAGTPDRQAPTIKILAPEPEIFNPALNNVGIRIFTSENLSSLVVKIYSPAGTKVWQSDNFPVANAADNPVVNITWNGRNSSGTIVNPDGKYTIEATATDSAGNSVTAVGEQKITVDTAPPGIK